MFLILADPINIYKETQHINIVGNWNVIQYKPKSYMAL